MHPWRERLHRWFSPIAAKSPLSPNAITVVALLLNVAGAALLYFHAFLLAIVFIGIGGLADAFDGIVARVQGKASRYGDFLDHVCDRVSDILVAAGWMLGNEIRPDLMIFTGIAVMLNGYLGTQIEATWHERRYDAIGRGEFVLALVVFPIVSHILFTNGWQRIAPGGLLIAEWMTILILLFALVGIVQRMKLAHRMEQGG